MAASGEASGIQNNAQTDLIIPSNDRAFSEFYTDVKAIESRDSVLTSKHQIERLMRPGATYFNLNPFDVLQVDPDLPLPEIKQKYRRMSILVHPDKNQDDPDRAQIAFEAVNKAYKTLENEEGYRRCKEIIEEAVSRTDEMVKSKRKQLKKESKSQVVPEDQPEKYKHAVYVQTCKLFADLERLRQEREAKDMHDRRDYPELHVYLDCKSSKSQTTGSCPATQVVAFWEKSVLTLPWKRLARGLRVATIGYRRQVRWLLLQALIRADKTGTSLSTDMASRYPLCKRKAEDEALEEDKKEMQAEWDKNFEESRMGRVSSWRTFTGKAKKSSKGKTSSKLGFRPPKHKMEQRE